MVASGIRFLADACLLFNALVVILPVAGKEADLAAATQDTASLEAYLAENGAEALTMPDPSGMRLSHWAASGGHVEVLKMLAKKGADPWDGTATAEEHSCLHMACRSGHSDVVKYLLSEPAMKLRSRGAFGSAKLAADSKDKRDTPCLHMAATAGNIEVLQTLASSGADMRAETKRSGTALHAAAAVGQVEAVKELLDLGLDVCAKNSKGETPGARAREEEMDEVIEVLSEKESAAGCGKEDKKKKKKNKKEKRKKEL